MIVLLIAANIENPLEELATDWIAFDRAADRVVAGEQVYRPFDAETESLPYLYPPYALWLALPLALFGFYGSFVFSAALTFFTLVGGAMLIARRGSLSPGDRGAAVTACVASGATITSTLIGQYSGLYALSIGAGTYLFDRGREGWAGAVLALLVLKPNIAIAVPVVLVWSRSWRALGGFVVGTALVIASSIPFGAGRWRGFVSNAQMMAELQRADIVPFDKMVTIQGSLQEAFGFGTSSPLLWLIWLIVVGGLGLAVLEVWRAEALTTSPIRAFGALALFMVAANVRLYFYDAVLVAVGSLAVFSVRDVVRSVGIRRLLGGCMIGVWVALWGGIFLTLNLLTGPIAGLIVLLVGTDAYVTRKSPIQRREANGSTGLSTFLGTAPLFPLTPRTHVGSAMKEKP